MNDEDYLVIKTMMRNMMVLRGLFFGKRMDIKDLVEIVILRYDHWPHFFFFKMS